MLMSSTNTTEEVMNNVDEAPAPVLAAESVSWNAIVATPGGGE